MAKHWLVPDKVCYYNCLGNINLPTHYFRKNPSGGIALIVKLGLEFTSLDLSCSCEDFEGEFAAVLLHEFNLIVMTMYRSPNGSVERFIILLELCFKFFYFIWPISSYWY